jgi:iron complex outermembrane receptor protein
MRAVSFLVPLLVWFPLLAGAVTAQAGAGADAPEAVQGPAPSEGKTPTDEAPAAPLHAPRADPADPIPADPAASGPTGDKAPTATPEPAGSAPKKKRRGDRKAAPETGQKAPDKDSGLEPIVVEGQHGDRDIEERRASTAAKMVFGREELDRYGDTSIGEVLKRLPGITISGRPGRGGDIRMRGLGHGYTQILINGDPAPRGFSFDTLAPEAVERIEIYRAPMAEHSARAIAGTINIVLREELKKHQTEVRLTGTLEKGHVQPGVSLQRSDAEGNFGYNVTLNAFGRSQGSEVYTTTTGISQPTGGPFLLERQYDDSRTRGEGVHLTSRLTWRLDGGDQLNLTPFLMQSRSPTHGYSLLDEPINLSPGPQVPLAPQAFSLADWVTQADTTIGRVSGDWLHNFGGGAKLKLRFLFGLALNDGSTQETEYGLQNNELFSSTSIHDRTLSNGGKFTFPVGTGGSVSTGWDLENVARQEGAVSLQDGAPQLVAFGSDIEASVTRVAGFAQRDWDFTPAWSGYSGLRWEGIETTSSDAMVAVRNQSSVWSPILQSLWKLGDVAQDRPDQVRLALARTYRAPSLNNLVARPTLSKLYPVSGPNAINSPDLIGNPQLRPEVAWGLDAALERYLAQGGIVSASAFHRSIENLMRTSTSLQSVSWSGYPRWVSEPQNVGQAQTSGVELEAKFRLAELLDEAPSIDFRSNYSRFWSTVSQIPGPNNRLDQQPKQTANLGLDDHLRSLPLTLGFNYNWTPAYFVQQSSTQIYGQGLKRVLDGYGLWVFSPSVRLRVSVSNALHKDYETSNAVLLDTPAGTASEDADAVARTYIAWSVRLEIKL